MTSPITTMADHPPTTDELRAAFNRVPLLHLAGWTFDKAMAVATVRWALEKSVLARRRAHHLPSQPRLI
jgi:hypothetical protein